jgi:NADPH:quinone reductase-like Zn-dependent oxidoreductase
VRVRVAATSFNGVDALGEGVAAWQVGDAVIGFLPFGDDGAAAEYVLATDSSPAPARIPLVDAAALPLVALTAYQALFEHAGLTSGQRILITGAGGAVGGYAVQLAKAAGAYVVATASARTAAQVEAHGADAVIDPHGRGRRRRGRRTGRRPA